jgi:hypothetical protein
MGIVQMVIKNLNFLILPRVLLLSAAISIVASPNTAQADGWLFEPILRVGAVRDDNAELSTRTDNEVELTGYLVDVRADINYNFSDITTFFFQPRALIRTYPDEPIYDSDDIFLRSTFRHRGRTNTFGFRVNYDKQSVRTAERAENDLNIDDPEEVDFDDTGLVGLEGDRARWRLSPYWSYQMSNISSIDMALDYYDTRYDNVFADLLVDYTDTRLSASYRRSMSNKTNAVATLTGRSFVPDNRLGDVNTDNTGIGALIGFEHSLTEKTRLVAMVGAENTEQTATGRTETNPIGSVTLTRDLETIRLFAQYQRAVAANGTGLIELRDTINMNFSRRLNQRISAGLGVRAYHAKRVGSSTSITDRNYIQLQTQFSWYVSKTFVIEADYTYTIMDRSNAIGERANANGIGLWFVYQPKSTPTL